MRDAIGRWLAGLNRQSDQRRAAVLGLAFGLLLIVILLLACLLFGLLLRLR